MDVPGYFQLHFWVLFSTCFKGGYSISTNNIYSSGCSNERINMDCPNHHKMAVKRLFYGVKNDSHCLSRGRQHSVDCCQPTHNDCLVVEDTEYPFLNMQCSGQKHCDIEAKSISSGMLCSAKGYGPSTDYLSVIHDCIPDANVSYLCSDSHITGNLLYISNDNYPQPIDPGNQQCQCLIKTRNHVGIDIFALNIIITRSENGSQCNQYIQFQDENGHQKVITCGHPGLYAFRNIYNSAVRSVTLTLNNKASKPQGYIWIQAKAKEDNDILDIYCGDAMRRHLGYHVAEAESRTIDNKNIVMHTPLVEQTNIYANSNGTSEGMTNFISDMMALIIGISVAIIMVIIIGLIGIIILCVRRGCKSQHPKCDQHPPFPSPQPTKKDNDHTSNTYCQYDYNEDKYCAIKRSPMRMSKFTNMDAFAGKKLSDAFSQGVCSPEHRNHNGYVNYMEHMLANQRKSLMENIQNTHQNNDNDVDDDNEIIMPRSEYIAIGKAIAPQAVTKEQAIPVVHQKKKLNKTVTFSPVTSVTPLPFDSEEFVLEGLEMEDPKLFICLEMHSQTLPSQSLDKMKKILQAPKSHDDMCLDYNYPSGLENVTEGDLWKAFKINLDDHVSSDPEISTKQCLATNIKEQHRVMEEPDYDENPYDNIPYLNVGSLRQHYTPENHQNDFYRDIVKRTLFHGSGSGLGT